MYGLTFAPLVNFMALFEVVVYFQTVSVVEQLVNYKL
jgi:hypothetical protein